jgi:hypothetical protein
MDRIYRRLVTGNNASGRSILVEDAEIRETGGAGNFNFWRTPSRDRVRGPTGPFPFFPAADETVFRMFRIPPDNPAMTRAAIEQVATDFFAELGDRRCKIDTRRHPLMHATPTVDYIMLLSGDAALILDEGEPIALKPFDAVVQRGTNHTWLNTGREDAVFLAVMLGADVAGG